MRTSSWRGGVAAASAPARSPSVRSRPSRLGHGQRQRLPRFHPASSCPGRAIQTQWGGVAPSDPCTLGWARDALRPARPCQDLRRKHHTARFEPGSLCTAGRAGRSTRRLGAVARARTLATAPAPKIALQLQPGGTVAGFEGCLDRPVRRNRKAHGSCWPCLRCADTRQPPVLTLESWRRLIVEHVQERALLYRS